ncbi:MAG: NADH-quinone oxidoreductase subunit N [Planctomycetes bacterium]|nr:NADH-quinone oxidoreductase subunit N [Planctomycetota bacterium]
MIQSDLARVYDADTLWAVSPAIALALGVLVLLMVGVVTHARWARGAVVAGTLGLSAVLQVVVLGDPPGAVFDGTFMADHASGLWGLLFLCGTAVAWLYSLNYYGEDRPYKVEHDVMMLTTPIGMMLMAGAQDLLLFFVGLELLSVPLYALCAFRRNRTRSVEAGLKYFLLGAFGAAFYLYGAALIFSATGTLSLAVLKDFGSFSTLAMSGVALLMASVFFKISVFPFHLWVPDVYEGAPTPVTALMATGTKAAAFAFLLRVTFLLPESAAMTVATIAIVTMALGNLGALVQQDVKRMLAYSGVAHAGTVLLVVAAALGGDRQPHGALDAALYYMAAYVFTAAGAFGLLAMLEQGGDRFTHIDNLRGLARRRPYTAAALTLFMLSLGGIPLTGGFLGKYLVFYSAVRADMIGVAVIGVLLSVVALGYYLRVVVALYMQPEPASLAGVAVPARRTLLPASFATGACAALVLLLGVLPRWFLTQIGS